MSFLDNLFTTGTATALATPTGSISVNTTAPVLDYVLKVISASPLRAGWAPEAGGGGGGAGAPVYTPHVSTAGTLSPLVDNAYLLIAPCVVTLPDATDPANLGRSIDLMFFSGPNTVNTTVLETPNIIADFGSATQTVSIPGGGVLFTCVYDPENYPYGFWLAQRYMPKPAGNTPPLRTSQIHSVYPAAELPAPYDTTTVGGVTTISGNLSTVGNLTRDMEGTYSVGDLVLFMFLSDVPGLYRCVRDNGGTDWAFDFVEGPGSAADPNGNPSYYTRIGETWGRRTIMCNQTEDPFYTFKREALDFYPNNGDILGTGSNSGLVHDNTTQLLPGRINKYSTSATYHSYVLAAPDANQERIFGERFGVKVVVWTGVSPSFTIDVTPAQIEGPDNLVADSTTFTMNIGTYAEWELMDDNVWHLVSWNEGSLGG